MLCIALGLHYLELVREQSSSGGTKKRGKVYIPILCHKSCPHDMNENHGPQKSSLFLTNWAPQGNFPWEPTQCSSSPVFLQCLSFNQIWYIILRQGWACSTSPGPVNKSKLMDITALYFCVLWMLEINAGCFKIKYLTEKKLNTIECCGAKFSHQQDLWVFYPTQS